MSTYVDCADVYFYWRKYFFHLSTYFTNLDLQSFALIESPKKKVNNVQVITNTIFLKFFTLQHQYV